MLLKSPQLYQVLAKRSHVASASVPSSLVNLKRSTQSSWLHTKAPSTAAAADISALNSGSPGTSISSANDVPTSQLATIPEHLKLFNLIKAYESKGHLIANLDPLHNAQLDPRRAPFVLEQVEILRKEHYGFKDSDLTKLFYIGDELPTIGPECTLQQVLRKLRKAYCGSVGVEYTHIIDSDRLHWISDRVWEMCAREDQYNQLTLTKIRRIAKEGNVTVGECIKRAATEPSDTTTDTSRDHHVKFGSIQTPADAQQQQQQLSGPGKVSRAQQLKTLELLARTARFENFCSRRFSGAKRFSIEGCETLITGLVAILDQASHNGVQCVEMGMAHRGRLNVLHNVLQIPFQTVAAEFQPYLPDNGDFPNNSDDVRYHVGCLVDYHTPTRKLTVSLASNPSHLEAVNAVVLGKTRARQFLQRGGSQEDGNDQLSDAAAARTNVATTGGDAGTSFSSSLSGGGGTGSIRLRGGAQVGNSGSVSGNGPLGMRGSVDYSPGDRARKEVMALLIHGDASFFQGSVRESLGFANLRDYSTGGTVHVIVNNQIGFTTMPKESHSSVYCSDVAKATGAPVFHVNGDDPDAVLRVFKLAVDYRQAFERDVVVNLWGYRRHGHNEQDTPELTQPNMYNTIKGHLPVTELYFESLLKDGVVEVGDLKHMYERIDKELSSCCDSAAGFGVKEPLDSTESSSENKLKPSLLGFWHELRKAWPSEDLQQQQLASPLSSKSNNTKTKDFPSVLSNRDTPQSGSQSDSPETIASGGGGGGERITEDLCLLDQVRTGVHLASLRTIGEAVFTLPSRDDFCAHEKVRGIYEQRLKALSAGQGIRWADAEALAFASLLSQGFHVRLSGQDVERGTFNQRHAVVYDQVRSLHTDEVIYKPWTGLQTLWDRGVLPDMGSDMLAAHHNPEADSIKRGAHWHELFRREKGLPPSLGVMEVCNSPLSEEAVLGFEHGFSLVSNHMLVVWEAQFGDFGNCAQTMIDTFVASGEAKWMRSCCLVMLLPHGYEGQGADHSSAKIERFLQLCNDDMDLIDNDRNVMDGNNTADYFSTSSSSSSSSSASYSIDALSNKIQCENDTNNINNNKDNINGADVSSLHQQQRQQHLQMVLWQQAQALKEVNMHVVNCSTPAQHFHVLRRQLLLPMRKPLVAFTPKSLLHHKPCASDLAHFSRDARFEAVLCHWAPGGIASAHSLTEKATVTKVEELDTCGTKNNNSNDNNNTSPSVNSALAGALYPVSTLTDIPIEAWRDGRLKSPRLVLLCSGKIRYQLARKRKALKFEDEVAIVSVEQLCPFPVGSIWQLLEGLSPPSLLSGSECDADLGNNDNKSKNKNLPIQLRWVQEEPRNMGAWTFAKPRLERCVWLMRGGDEDVDEDGGVVSSEVEYVGRPSAAYAATGSFAQHLEEMEAIVHDAFNMPSE